jgi:RHS repeat-associated protein
LEDRIHTVDFSYEPGVQCGLIHNDHLGTPQKMTDASGTVVWSADYKPFGEATVTVSTITNNLRFPGQYFDAETGLNYNYYRDYNPAIGRYLEADPIGIKRGINHLYSYTSDNPINKKDQFGLQTQCGNTCPGGVWSGAGGSVGGIFFTGGVFTGVYHVTCWSANVSCWIMTTCYGTGAGLGGSIGPESMWIWGAYSPSGLAGTTAGGVGTGGAGVAGIGGSYGAGGTTTNPASNNPIQNPSTSSSASYGAGLGAGGGYIVGQCTTTVLSCN